MSRLQQLETALINADRAGDEAAARQLAAAIKAERAKEQPSIGRQALAAAADNGAALIEGVAALPDMAASALGRGMGFVARAFGADGVAAQLENPFTFGGAARRAAPEVAGNAVPRAVINAVGGLAGGLGAGRAIAGAGSTAVQQGVARTLADAPRAQIVGGTAANLAVAGAQMAGAPVGVQAAAALAAGGLAPSALDSAGVAGGRVIAPLTRGYGREQAARILKDNVVGNVDDVARRIRVATSRPSVSGASPTTAEVAGDAGLAGFQRSLQSNSQAGGRISDRMGSNARIRLSAVDNALGPGDVTRLADEAAETARRNAVMLGAARDRVGPLEPADVTGLRARETLQQAAAGAKARASRLYDIPGGEEPVQVGAFDFEPPMPASGRSAGRVAFQQAAEDALRGPGRAADEGPTVFGFMRPRTERLPNGSTRTVGGVKLGSPLDRELRAMGYGPKQLPGLFRQNGTIRSPDDLRDTLIENGFLRGDSGTVDPQEVLDLIDADLRAMGRGGGRAGSRPVADAGMNARMDADAADRNYWDWRQRFDEAGFDPDRMSAEDWDAFYRRAEGVPPVEMTAADADFLGRGASDADRRIPLSPFQGSLLELQRQYFPAGLPQNSGVGKLVNDLVRADVMETRQVERIVRDLRAQAGRLRASDGVSAGLAKAAANAAEGFLSSQAGPARMQAMQRARQGWREYSSTFRENEPGRVLATNQFGTPQLDAGRVPGALVPAGRTGGTAAMRLQAAVGPDQAEGIARTELRRALEQAGSDADRVAAVADRYSDTLRAFPDAARDVQAARETAALGAAFARSPLASFTNAGDPIATVGRLVREQDGGRGLRQLTAQTRGNPEAQAGLRRALAGYIETAAESRSLVDASGRPSVVNNPFRTVLNDVLGKTANTNLLTREQRSVLLNVRREAKGAQFALTANRPAGSDTARNAETWARFAEVVMRTNPKTGAAKTALDFVIATLGRADAVRQLTVEAMLDPKLAADLLQTPTPDRLRSLASRMNAYNRGALVAAYSADNM